MWFAKKCLNIVRLSTAREQPAFTDRGEGLDATSQWGIHPNQVEAKNMKAGL